jgi:hypothetical protein
MWFKILGRTRRMVGPTREDVMTLTQHKRISKRDMRRRLHPYMATAAQCPNCHEIRGIFTRDRFGQMVCVPCSRGR